MEIRQASDTVLFFLFRRRSMKRRSILAALAASPLALFAGTAHALGRRRERRSCEQPCSGPLRGVGPPSLTFSNKHEDPQMPGMYLYNVTITADLTLDNSTGIVQERVRSVEATLDDQNSTILNNDDFTQTTSGTTYTFTKTNQQLTPTQNYHANVTAYIDKESYANVTKPAP
jgi:hypothetical protein